MLHHGALHRVQAAICPAQMFNRDHMAAVAGCQKADAGIHGLIAQRAALDAPHKHGASTAIALGAALFGAAQALIQPQMVQQRGGCAYAIQHHLSVVQQKADMVAGHGASFGVRRLSCLQDSLRQSGIPCKRAQG